MNIGSVAELEAGFARAIWSLVSPMCDAKKALGPPQQRRRHLN
jgi:hypothetical protein